MTRPVILNEPSLLVKCFSFSTTDTLYANWEAACIIRLPACRPNKKDNERKGERKGSLNGHTPAHGSGRDSLSTLFLCGIEAMEKS